MNKFEKWCESENAGTPNNLDIVKEKLLSITETIATINISDEHKNALFEALLSKVKEVKQSVSEFEVNVASYRKLATERGEKPTQINIPEGFGADCPEELTATPKKDAGSPNKWRHYAIMQGKLINRYGVLQFNVTGVRYITK